jgi:hypothetical protein
MACDPDSRLKQLTILDSVVGRKHRQRRGGIAPMDMGNGKE